MWMLSSREISNCQTPKGKNVGLKLNIERDIQYGVGGNNHLHRSFSCIPKNSGSCWNLKEQSHLRSPTQSKRCVVVYRCELYEKGFFFSLKYANQREKKTCMLHFIVLNCMASHIYCGFFWFVCLFV